MLGIFAVILTGFFAALNAVIYVQYGAAISLGAAIFCGILCLFNIAMVTSRG